MKKILVLIFTLSFAFAANTTNETKKEISKVDGFSITIDDFKFIMVNKCDNYEKGDIVEFIGNKGPYCLETTLINLSKNGAKCRVLCDL